MVTEGSHLGQFFTTAASESHLDKLLAVSQRRYKTVNRSVRELYRLARWLQHFSTLPQVAVVMTVVVNGYWMDGVRSHAEIHTVRTRLEELLFTVKGNAAMTINYCMIPL